MPTVELDTEEWQKVIGCIAQAPWNVANPLLMKIGEQLRLSESVQKLKPNSKRDWTGQEKQS